MRRKAAPSDRRPGGAWEPAAGPRWTAAEALCLGLVVATFSWICFRNILQPGYYGDEAWQAVEAARFVWGKAAVHPAYFYRLEIFGHVLPKMLNMLNTYIGPVNAYVLAVPFSIFGVSVPVQRATTGAVGLLGVVALYFLARREFGRLAAAASALLLASDLSLALAMRCDWGPVDFAFPARVASILLLLAWRRNRAPWLLFLGSLLLGLGLSFKFDFLGTIAAVAVAGAVCYGRGLHARVREAAVAAGGFLLGAWPILLYNAMTRFNTLRTGAKMSRASAHEAIGLAVVHRLRTLEDLLNGGVGQFMLGENFRKSSLFGGSLLPAALLFLPFLLFVPLAVRTLAPWRRPLGFVVAVSAVLLLAIAAVPMATGPHHVLSLYPFPHLLLGVALAGLWHAGRNAPRGLLWPTRLAAAAGFFVLFVSNLALAETFHERLAVRGGDRYWSESIYELSAALARDYPGDVAELLDWGFEQPLIILGKDRIPLHPLFWRIQGDPAPEGWLADLIRQPHRVFVRRAPPFAFDRTVHDRFDAAVKQAPDLAVEERQFFQKDGQLSFSLLKFRPRS
jgi:4-amino-4-deoxy-L-arabinose transferase-like glycosyltransferase